jgi:general secretion pathway protein K
MTLAVRELARCPALSNQRGVALIIVLWIFIFLFVVAFDFSRSVREEATAALRYSDQTQGYYLAIAGFQKGLYDFLNQVPGRNIQRDTPPEDDLFAGGWREDQLGGGIYRARLIDEGGKVNLNRANEALLRRIFTNLGVEEPQRGILIDSILDWRDGDDLHRMNGAESDYYLNLPQPYTAKNGPFDSIEDLLWVRGMTPELFYGESHDERKPAVEHRPVGLRAIFTIDSPIDRINLRTASAEVIYAVSAIPLEKARAFVQDRQKLSNRTIGDLLPLLGISAGDPALQSFIFTNPSVVSIEAEGKPAESGVARRVKGVVRIGGGRQGFELLRWIDRDTGVPEE